MLSDRLVSNLELFYSFIIYYVAQLFGLLGTETSTSRTLSLVCIPLLWMQRLPVARLLFKVCSARTSKYSYYSILNDDMICLLLVLVFVVYICSNGGILCSLCSVLWTSCCGCCPHPCR